MTVTQALALTGISSRVNPFGWNSKMPGPTYDLPADECKRGSALAKDPQSMCHPSKCYAKRNRFKWPNMIKARYNHLESLTNEGWVEAIVFLIRRYYLDKANDHAALVAASLNAVASSINDRANEEADFSGDNRKGGGTLYFRWHGSGDLQGAWHLRKIVEVALALPEVRFWLPTHETMLISAFLITGGVIPENLCVRVSADRIGERPNFANLSGPVRLLPTSTVHHPDDHPVAVSARRGDSVECRAYTRNHACGSCRACWSRPDPRNPSKPFVKNVSYPETRAGRPSSHAVRSNLLRVIP